MFCPIETKPGLVERPATRQPVRNKPVPSLCYHHPNLPKPHLSTPIAPHRSRLGCGIFSDPPDPATVAAHRRQTYNTTQRAPPTLTASTLPHTPHHHIHTLNPSTPSHFHPNPRHRLPHQAVSHVTPHRLRITTSARTLTQSANCQCPRNVPGRS